MKRKVIRELHGCERLTDAELIMFTFRRARPDYVGLGQLRKRLAQRKLLLDALRIECIAPSTQDVNRKRCRYCGSEWEYGSTEKHPDTCLCRMDESSEDADDRQQIERLEKRLRSPIHPPQSPPLDTKLGTKLKS